MDVTVHRFLTPMDMAAHSFSVHGAVAWQSCHVLGLGIAHLVDHQHLVGTSARSPASRPLQAVSQSRRAGWPLWVGTIGGAMAGADGSRCFLSFQGCIG